MKWISLLILISIKLNAFSQLVHSSDYLVNSSIRINCQKIITKDGRTDTLDISGTGFYFYYSTPKGYFPVIVSNKHLINGMNKQILQFKHADSIGNPLVGLSENVILQNPETKWMLHPDSDVDLAILPIGGLLNNFKSKNISIYFKGFDETLIPNDSTKKSLMAIEEVLMIGYPFGLRDDINDLPVVRRGLTATPFDKDFNGKKIFLCDIPVYPGSSGSPVLIYNPTSFSAKDGNMYLKSRIILLGINFATYTRDFTAKILPTSTIATAIPYNIGIIIKSERLLDFKKFIN
ncbi:S1 family peptidase [Pedobacter sp.]|uniref:S1 family peptidase n=1 Tax=Pedobacter sp. TaxID=1411316 RepID=UPI003BAD414F